MNLLLFIMTLIGSFIALRIGAIAFELTGLEWSLAKFQTLSCFTGTGFAAKEAELITMSSIEVCKDSSILDKTLRKANLRNFDTTILVIEKKETTIPNSSADMEVVLGDKLVCFGKLEDMRNKLCVVSG